MKEFIAIQNGHAVTTDLLIAKAFNKTPSSVRRAIRNLKCSEEFRLHNFAHTSYIDQQGLTIVSTSQPLQLKWILTE